MFGALHRIASRCKDLRVMAPPEKATYAERRLPSFSPAGSVHVHEHAVGGLPLAVAAGDCIGFALAGGIRFA